MRLSIEKLVYGGDGLARYHGKAVFLPFVLEGEQVEAEIIEEKPGYARARAQQVVAPSSQRISPGCPYFGACGGCQYQHATYRHQLELKEKILRESLRRIAKLEWSKEIHVHPSPEWNYRNRTRLHVLHPSALDEGALPPHHIQNGDALGAPAFHPSAPKSGALGAPALGTPVRSSPAFALAYYRFSSHQLLAVEECPISSPLINRAIATVWELGRAGNFTATIVEIEFFAQPDDSQLLVQIYCDQRKLDSDQADRLAQALSDALPELLGVVFFEQRAAKTFAADFDAGRQLGVAGEDALLYRTRSRDYRVTAGSFFQTNRFLTDELLEIVTRGRAGRLALDLYAGVGFFAAALARSFERVVAVEASPLSFADLEHNAARNVKAVRATTERYLERNSKLRPDMVAVDPPRSGLGEKVARRLAKLSPSRITYVSCDPATLCRDLRVLIESGLQVEEIHLVDLFPQTFHIESVVQLAPG